MTDDCSRHPDRVPGYDGTVEQLGADIESMTYDAQLRLLNAYQIATRARAKSDLAHGKERLGHRLATAAQELANVKYSIMLAAEICAPHMGKDGDG